MFCDSVEVPWRTNRSADGLLPIPVSLVVTCDVLCGAVVGVRPPVCAGDSASCSPRRQAIVSSCCWTDCPDGRRANCAMVVSCTGPPCASAPRLCRDGGDTRKPDGGEVT